MQGAAIRLVLTTTEMVETATVMGHEKKKKSSHLETNTSWQFYQYLK
jgi:hypothetical protein